MNTEHYINLQPGSLIAGRFEVLKCLGSGSMGLVYACRDRELSGRTVAAKVLYPEVSADEVSVARFRNEIFSSYGVSHPNVIRSYEFIRDGDLIAYTMEFVDGGVLLDFIESKKRIEINEAIRLMIEMCAGVQAIHDAGIVHRDLKPENILITKENSVKIADFGIARTDHGPKLTEHGGVIGTIDYVSPEYMLESKVDWRSDIYALGVLSFELITGQAPFKADNLIAAMTLRLQSDPPNPSNYRSECPPELDTIILRAMNRNPEERYQSAAEMGSDLLKIYQGKNPVKSQSFQGMVTESRQPVYQEPKQASGATAILENRSMASLIPNQEVKFKPDSADHTIKVVQAESAKPKSGVSFKVNESSLSDTQTLEPEIVDIASYYQSNPQMQLESVISRSNVPPKVSKLTKPEVVTNSSGIDQQRLKRLRHQSEALRRLTVFERIFIGFIAFVSILAGGIGGYYLIQYLVPEEKPPVVVAQPQKTSPEVTKGQKDTIKVGQKEVGGVKQ